MNHQEHTYPIKLTNPSADWLNSAITSKGLKICPHRSLIIVHDRSMTMMSKKFGPRGLQLMKLLRGVNLVLEMGRPRRVHSVKLYDRSARGDTLVEIMVRQNMTVRNTWVEYLEFMSGVTSSGRLHLVNPYTYKEKLLTPNKNLKGSADVERKYELSRAGWSYLF